MYIKGFNKDSQCVVDGNVTQYEIGKIYDTGYTENLKLCSETVIHFCDSIQKVHNYYSCDSDNRFCEIEVLGEIVQDSKKCGSNKIRIIREIVFACYNIKWLTVRFILHSVAPKTVM